MALTDAKIRALKPKAKAYKVSDFGGLYINVTTKGSKLWRLKYRFNGKEGKLSFGPYPDISLKDARDLREEARAQLAKGMVMPPFLVGIISRLVFKRHVSCAAQVFGRGLFRLSPC